MEDDMSARQQHKADASAAQLEEDAAEVERRLAQAIESYGRKEVSRMEEPQLRAKIGPKNWKVVDACGTERPVGFVDGAFEVACKRMSL
jgi:uncharacterized protein YqfA (UPF0365 family)